MTRTLRMLGCVLLLLGLAGWMLPSSALASPPVQGQAADDDDADTDSDDSDTKKPKARKKGKKKKKAKEAAERLDEANSAAGEAKDESAGSADGGGEQSPPEKALREGGTSDGLADAGAPEGNPEATGAEQPTEQSPEGASPAIGGLYNPTPKPPTRMVRELRTLWGVVVLLGVAFVLLLLNFLLPLGFLRFLSQGANLCLWLATFGLLSVLGSRLFLLRNVPGSFIYTGLLWFSFSALLAHQLKRPAFPKVYLSGLPLSFIVLGVLLWQLSAGRLLSMGVGALHTSSLRTTANFCMYTSFGLLLAAGSWLLSSGFLGILARRSRGSGYGLETPEQWNEYRLHPGFLVLIAYPFLTVAWVLQMLWSSQYFTTPWVAWSLEPRTWTALFCWLLLSAYLVALRIPKKEPEFTLDQETAVDQPGKLPSFLLLFATLGGSLLFVSAHLLAPLFRG